MFRQVPELDRFAPAPLLLIIPSLFMRHNAVQEQSSEAQVRPASGAGKDFGPDIRGVEPKTFTMCWR